MRKVFTLFALMSLLFVTAKAQITEKPAGAETMYVRSGSAFAPTEGSADLKVQSQAGKVARIVYDSDGTTVYIATPVSKFPDPVWVKGTLSDDKTTISVALGQVVGHDAKHNTDLVLALLDAKEVVSGGNTYYEYERDASATTVDYSVSVNYIYLNGTSQSRIFGVVYADDGQWTGYGDYGTTYTVMNDKVTELPAEVTTSSYTLYATNDDKSVRRTVSVGMTDTEVYIQGLSKMMPEAWAKGEFNDNKRIVTFPVQFLGVTDTDYPVYICRYAGGTAINELVLVYNSETKSFNISSREEPIMLENATKIGAGYYYKYENLSLAPGEDATVAPADDSSKSPYLLKSFTYDGDVSRPVSVVMADDKVYIQGIAPQMPDSWVMGVKTADGYEFASPQYLGSDASGKPYFFIAESGSAIVDKCVFAFDAANSTFSTPTTCAISTDRVKPREVVIFYGIDLAPFVETADAVPADPIIDSVYPDDYELDYDVEPVSTDGDDLDESKLSLVFYSDIEGTVEPIKFMPDDYPEFEEVTVMVPYGFSSDNFGTGWMNYPENDDFNRIGIQLVYTTESGETRSNIVWADIKAYTTAISSATADSSAAKRYFMLNGVETKSPAGKVVIVKSGNKVRKVVVR